MPAPASWSEPGWFWLPRSCRVDADRFTVGTQLVSLRSAFQLYHRYEKTNSFEIIHQPVVSYLLWHFLTITLWCLKCFHLTGKLNPHQLQLSRPYLFAFSRTERVRKLIQIPSLCPKIHSRIPAHEQTVRGNPPLRT